MKALLNPLDIEAKILFRARLRAQRLQTWQLIYRICTEKRRARIAPALATWIEVMNRYEGSPETLVWEIDRLEQLKLIRKTRTINYDAYII